MADPQLVAYIREHQAHFSKEQLVQTLSNVGWAAPDISDAFRELETPAAPFPTIESSSDFMTEMAKRRQSTAFEQTPQPSYQGAMGSAPTYRSADIIPSTAQKGIVGVLVRYKLARNASQANSILIAIVIVCAGLSLWLLWPRNGSLSAPQMTSGTVSP